MSLFPVNFPFSFHLLSQFIFFVYWQNIFQKTNLKFCIFRMQYSTMLKHVPQQKSMNESKTVCVSSTMQMLPQFWLFYIVLLDLYSLRAHSNSKCYKFKSASMNQIDFIQCSHSTTFEHFAKWYRLCVAIMLQNL